MEIWQHITSYTEQNACNSSPNQWNFRHLEITGQRCEVPRNIEEICKRIPKLKVETKVRYVKPRVESKLGINFRFKPPRTAPKSPPKPKKEREVSIKFLIPKASDENLSRNCVCTCESQENIKTGNGETERTAGPDEDGDDMSFKELLDLIEKYDNGTHKNGSNVICNLVKRFKGNNLLNEEEVKRVLKMLDSSNLIVEKSLLMLINYVSSSSSTAKLLLQHDILNDLIYLMLMGVTDDVQLQAACCIAKLTEREELSNLWIETMVISGAEALFEIFSADEKIVSESLRIATLDAVMSLANNQKMAAVLINRFDLRSIIDLARCKNDEGKAFGSPATQRAAMMVLTSLLSHTCEIVEQFLSKYSEAVDRIVDIYNTAHGIPLQRAAARFLSMLTSFPPGIDPVISQHATEHLLWAMTCSHCRFVRENASKAFKNIAQHSDKAKILSALEQFSITQIDQPLDVKRGFNSLKSQPTSTKIISDLKKHTSISKLEKIMVDIFSVVSLSFQTDSLLLCGSNRTFINDSQVKGARNDKGISIKGVNEQYLSSLRVLVNILVAMEALMRLKDKDENDKEIPCALGNGANLSLVALFIQCGGLQFLNQLQFLSNKLQRVNRPNFHSIDPTTLPPKEIISSIKHSRSELIFSASGQKQKPKKRYPDFGLHSAEIHFVGQAIEFLVLLAQSTTQDFDLAREDLDVFVNSRPPPTLAKKKHISFQTSALIVRSAVRASSPRGGEDKEARDTGGRKILKRQSSARSLSSRTTDSRHTTASQASKLPSSPSVVELGTSSRNEMVHYVKQSLLGANIVSYLAVWVTCGVYDIQKGVIKVLRYLMHLSIISKRVTSDQVLNDQLQEAWTTKTKKPAKSTKPSQRSSVSPPNKPKNKSTQLSHMCVRHVIQYCGAYLLDLLEPPATGILGRLSLMVIREAVINGENDSRLKLVKLGCLSQIINYIRGTEDEPEIQSLGLLVLRSLVSSNQALKQLFLAHGGMSFVMALYEYKEGLVKEEAACTLKMFSRVSTNTTSKTKSQAAHSKKSCSRIQASGNDIWDHVTKKWESQDKVAKLLTKFNVRYTEEIFHVGSQS